MGFWDHIKHRYRFRSKENIIEYVKIEWALFKQEWKVIIPCIIMQYVHGVFHNVAYWIQAHEVATRQRFILWDLGYEIFPELPDKYSFLSELFVFGGIFAPGILLICTIPVFVQNPKHPRYLVIVLKRTLMHISICLFFRIVSFLVTALPSPARHCRLDFDEECLQKNGNNYLDCVKPNKEFNPPNVGEIFYNMDALEGCGDLMFSSHTIYSLSIILVVYKYWPSKKLLGIMLAVLTAIAILIVAARKHYTLDVYSALYIVPLIWLVQEAYYKDINNKDVQINAKTIHEFYGVDVTPDLNNGAQAHASSTPLEAVQVEMTNDDTADVYTPQGNESSATFSRENK